MEHTFRAGAAETDITPSLGALLTGSFSPRPAEDIHDPLYAKALVLDDGNERLALVILDLIAIPLDITLRVRDLVTEHTGIPGTNVLISCTHTHTGPQTRQNPNMPRDEQYIDWLVVKISDAIRLAVNRLQPARIAWGQGEHHDISFCRRFLMSDGTVRTNPRRHGGGGGLAGTDDVSIVKPVSPIDPLVGVLAVENLDGRPIAVVTRFSLHYVGTDHSLTISADYYGHFAKVMRRHLGDECIPMLFNGTSGQINNANPLGPPRKTRGHAQAKKVAAALAGEVLKVLSKIEPRTECTLGARATRVKIPCKHVTEEDRAIASQILAGKDPSPHSGPFSFVVGQPIPENLRPHYARRVLDMAPYMESEVQVLRIGESAWVGLPGEIFVETGFAIRENSPTNDTFVIGLTNDSVSYVATDHALVHEGGYETWAPAGVGAEGVLIDTSSTFLNELFPNVADTAS